MKVENAANNIIKAEKKATSLVSGLKISLL